jgi:small subunit ribosomal protein S7
VPRRREIPKREILPDQVYGSQLVTKFVNVMMQDGKKSTAERILYDALEAIAEKAEDGDSLKVFKKAVENVKPSVEVKSRRVGGSTYQVPVEVRPGRRLALAMRWLIQIASARGEKTMRQRLAGELQEAAEGRGGAVKKKEDTHRMAEANNAFAHYRW